MAALARAETWLLGRLLTRAQRRRVAQVNELLKVITDLEQVVPEVVALIEAGKEIEGQIAQLAGRAAAVHVALSNAVQPKTAPAA